MNVLMVIGILKIQAILVHHVLLKQNVSIRLDHSNAVEVDIKEDQLIQPSVKVLSSLQASNPYLLPLLTVPPCTISGGKENRSH